MIGDEWQKVGIKKLLSVAVITGPGASCRQRRGAVLAGGKNRLKARCGERDQYQIGAA